MVAGFSADQSEICQGGQVQFTDESTGNPTSWSWTFEGGTPSTSSLQHPLVTYETPGFFDVSLTVTSGSNNSSTQSPDAITVNISPEVTLMPWDEVCEYWDPFLLEGGMPEGGIYSGTGVENGIFYPAIAGLGSHIITYTFVDPATDCSDFAEETIVVSICTGVSVPAVEFFRIYPNPSKGELFVEVTQRGDYTLRLTNILGAMVLEQKISESTMIHLKDLESGLYTVTLTDGTTSLTRKLTLRN